MATFTTGQKQSILETSRTYTVDFTNDLPSGGTVTGGTATHIPPSGAASSVSISVSSPYLYATLPRQSALGVHYLEIIGQFNDGDDSSVRLPLYVVHPSAVARDGMSDIISDLRGMTDSNADEYEIAGVSWWSDAQLQRICDKHRTDIKWLEMTAMEDGDGTYTEYTIGYGNIEITTGGTAVFFVQDVNGDKIDSSGYSVDYLRGVVTFDADTLGVPYYVTGRSYDLDGAAAEVWRMKQSHFASAVDFSTKVHNVSRSQLYDQAKERAEYFEGKSDSGFGSISIFRSDTDD